MGQREQEGINIMPDPDTVLKEILNEYPGLQSIHNLNDTKVMFASPERIKAATEASKTWSSNPNGDPGYLEYWPKTETGIPGFPHPTEGKHNVMEIYNQELKNPDVLKPMLLGDMLHGMVQDPEFAKMREAFKANFSPKAIELITKNRGNNDFLNPNTTVDAFIRGGLVPYKNGNWLEQDPSLYSLEQLKILDNMKKYLRGNEETK